MNDRIKAIIDGVIAVEGGFVDHPSADMVMMMQAALDAQSAAAGKVPELRNGRGRPCSGPSCDREAFAGGLCNAHYLRKRRGSDLSRPVRGAHRSKLCTRCDAPVGSQGAWGLCPRHFKRERLLTLKTALIAAFGGTCARCCEPYHPAAFDFHHRADKDEAVSVLMANASLERIADEVRKCILLCANCHRVEHAHE